MEQPDSHATGPHDDQPPARPRLLTAAQVAERLGGGDITERTVKRSYRTWGLDPTRVGRKLRWEESTVSQWIESQSRRD